MNTPQIKFIGVGGGGSNIADYLYQRKAGGLDYLCINTDVDGLDQIKVKTKMLIGQTIAGGKGCGRDAELGRLSAEDAREKIKLEIQEAKAVFICAGMAGGTGAGTSPVIAQIAHETGATAIVLAIMPFQFEGALLQQAQDAINSLPSIIPYIELHNDRLATVFGGNTSLDDAFAAMNDWIIQLVTGLSDQITANVPLRLEPASPLVGNYRI